MELFNLADKQEYFEQVVDWIFSEWGIQGKKSNRNFWECWIKSSLSRSDIPQTYIAINENELVATFSLWRCDMQSRQDIFPWFGGLYVNKRYRGTGIGKQMQKEALDILRSLGYEKIHLFTDIEGYYETTGWDFLQMIPDENGNLVRLYQRSTEPLLLER